MKDHTDILNWRRWNDAISLSGQPTEDQLADLAKSGVTNVVNLGPHSNDGALPDEPGTVEQLGMTYTYIPVDFENPTDADFSAFCDALAQVAGERVHVHCIYNARVSAFMYRYASEGRGGQRDEAFALMDGIWRPGGVWATFIDDADSVDLPNRFAGYEY
ncbi:MAG: protein tyrosine phosphatase family protein [Pseudomonadota bacterium]